MAGWLVRLPVAVLAVSLASALTLGLSAPGAAADSLTDRRQQVTQQLAKTRSDLNESSRALSAAGVAVDQAQSRLDVARAALAQTESELADARARDTAMAKKLVLAKAALVAAKRAVAKAQRALDAEVAMAGAILRDQYQQQTNLLPLAVLIQGDSTVDLQTRIQWSRTMFDTSAFTIDKLTALKTKLAAEKAVQAKLTAEVAEDRLSAAANLTLKRKLERQAADQERSVTALVQQRQAVENAAAGEVAQDKAQYAKLAQERASVEHRIAVRVAKAKVAAARQAAHERAVRAAAARAATKAAAKSAAAAKRAKTSAKTPVRRSTPVQPAPAPAPAPSSGSGGGGSSSSGAHHGFDYPVSAPITSPYGMRFHPVLHYWKLHDGTDFGASCGTPIRAPYPGRVAERYYNAGYGNRLMIDHGRVDGRYVTTGYNHAIRYVVSVGQHVDKGQVIGYVGTTGFSTGCHLHLMVWLNGSVVNPMTWY
ncbi:peptidoglycan DD-metalloendopeptidase family protein [uncultured Friedmanniella sp.]|uniref:peptidoglycan DD-metalloendopeptidase family protein n=1 Tax=uncultured Friedmanniella sp. TaxID=335381 RepID=UPI0035C9E6AD